MSRLGSRQGRGGGQLRSTVSADVDTGSEALAVLGRRMPTEIGAQIYSRRKSLRWCRYTLAERSSVGRSQIKAIEEGWTQPSAESVRKIIECISAAEIEAQDKISIPFQP